MLAVGFAQERTAAVAVAVVAVAAIQLEREMRSHLPS